MPDNGEHIATERAAALAAELEVLERAMTAMATAQEATDLRRSLRRWRIACAFLFVGGTVQWLAYLLS